MTPSSASWCARPNWIGDVVLSLAAVRDLRRNFPAARIEVLARPWVADALRRRGRGRRGAASRGVARRRGVAARRVRRRRCCCPTRSAAALAAWLAGIPERWGYATDGRGPLLTRARARPAAGPGPQPGVLLSGDARGRRARRLGDARRVARAARRRGRARGGGAPGRRRALDRPQPRRLLRHRQALAARALRRRGRPPGPADAARGSRSWAAPRERPLGEAIAARHARARARPLRRDDAARAGGRALAAAPAGHQRLRAHAPGGRARRAAWWRCSAPPTGARRRPWATRQRLVREPVHCSPCLLRECPIDHRCMTRVAVDRVVAEARALLAAG